MQGFYLRLVVIIRANNFLFVTVGLLCQPTATVGWFSNVVRDAKPPTTSIPKNAKVLILPGFGNDSSDYVLEQAPIGSLVSSLAERGWVTAPDCDENQIFVLPIKRSDWIQVFSNGIFDIQFWQGSAPPTRPAFRWYLNRILSCVNEITKTTPSTDERSRDDCAEVENCKVILIGHSAGGWLGRAALGYGSTGDDENDFPKQTDLLEKIGGIVTLGAPNLPPPPPVMDMTRGALKLTSEQFPGAYHAVDKQGRRETKEDGGDDDHSNANMFYITVSGDAVQGEKQERKTPFEQTSLSGFAFNSYEAVCGNGTEVGDGVVPIISSHLDGATQLNLRGVFHSINVPDRWYGSNTIIDLWHSEMLRQFNSRYYPMNEEK
jgi:hypothetical protein